MGGSARDSKVGVMVVAVIAAMVVGAFALLSSSDELPATGTIVTRTPAASETPEPYPLPPLTALPELLMVSTVTPDATVVAMPDQEFVEQWLTDLEAKVTADARYARVFRPPFQVLALSHVYPGQMTEAGLSYQDVFRTSSPDLAFIVSGGFREMGAGRESSYCLFVVDRSSRYMLMKRVSDSLGELEQLLPPDITPTAVRTETPDTTASPTP